jgi:hypothetical protein
MHFAEIVGLFAASAFAGLVLIVGVVTYFKRRQREDDERERGGPGPSPPD